MFYSIFLIHTHSVIETVEYQKMYFNINTETKYATFIFTRLRNLTLPNNFEYNSNAYKVTEIEPNQTLSVNSLVIPKSIVKMNLTEFPQLKELRLEEGITTIGTNWFSNLEVEINIDLPDSVTTISDSAFMNSHVLNVTYGPNLRSIGSHAFEKSSLIAFKPRGSNGITSVASHAFRDCEKLVDVFSVLEHLTIINNGTFYKDRFLRLNVTLPDELTTIDYEAFSKSGVKNVTFGPKLTTIGFGAFAGSELLRLIPRGENNIRSVAEEAFSFTSDLEDLTAIIKNLDVINASTFSVSKLKYDITFPDTLKVIKEKAFQLTQILNIKFPPSLTEVHDSAFQSSTELLTFKPISQNKITTVGKFVFNGCSQMKDCFCILDNINYVPEGTFRDCTNLYQAEWTLPDHITEIQSSAFANTKIIKFHYGPNLVKLGDTLFVSGLITDFTPTGESKITDIPARMFQGCSSLLNVGDLIENAKAIGDYAFADTMQYTKAVTLHCTKVGDRAFRGSAIPSVVYDENLVEVGFECFAGSKITSIKPSGQNNLVTIGAGVFKDCEKISDFWDAISLLTVYPSSMLEGCKQLTGELAIKDGITEIQNSTFSGTGYTTVVYPESLTKLGNKVFCRCKQLQSVSPKGANKITEIGSGTFIECYAFTTDNNILANINYIPAEMYKSCSKIPTEVELDDRIVSVGDSAYSNTKITKVSYGSLLTELGPSAFRQTNIAEFTPRNEHHITQIGENCFQSCTELTDISTIISKLKDIPDALFSDCSSIDETLTLPDDIESIGQSAFQGSSVTEVTFGDKLKSIGNNAFDSTEITSFKPRGASNLESLGEYCFSYCESLSDVSEIIASVKNYGKGVFEGCSSIAGDIILPEGLINISETLFSSTGITSVTIPDSVENIEISAFSDTPLTTVKFAKDGHNFKTLGEMAFEGCESLESVPIFKLPVIPQACFKGCSSLKSFDFSSVKEIGSEAFLGTAFESLAFSQPVAVREGTFNECHNLQKIDGFENIIILGDSAFASAPLSQQKKLDLRNCKSVYETAFMNNQLGEVEIIFNYAQGINSDYFQSDTISPTYHIILDVDETMDKKITESGAKYSLILESIYNIDLTISDGIFENSNQLTNLKIKTESVTLKDNSFQNTQELKEVTFDCNNITIGSHAFSKSSITTFNSKNTKSEINVGDYAFADASSFTKFVFGNERNSLSNDDEPGIATLGSYAFENTKIESIPKVYKYAAPNAFARLPIKELTLTTEKMGSKAVSDCPELEKIIIGSNVMELPTNFAVDCPKLVEIDFAQDGNKPLNLGEKCFDSIKLQKINRLPERTTGINGFVFKNCLILAGDLILPKNIQIIGESAFEGCTNLNGGLNMKYCSQLKAINARAFFGCQFKGDLEFPSSLQTIGNEAFMSCSRFDGIIKFNSDLTYIGDKAFFNLDKITGTIEIPSTVEYVGGFAFANLSKVTGELKLSSKLAKIGEYAFSNMNGVSGALVIPDSVKYIGVRAFHGCTSVERVLIMNNDIFIDTKAFGNMSFHCIDNLPWNCSRLNYKESLCYDTFLLSKDSQDPKICENCNAYDNQIAMKIVKPVSIGVSCAILIPIIILIIFYFVSGRRRSDIEQYEEFCRLIVENQGHSKDRKEKIVSAFKSACSENASQRPFNIGKGTCKRILRKEIKSQIRDCTEIDEIVNESVATMNVPSFGQRFVRNVFYCCRDDADINSSILSGNLLNTAI